MAEKFIDMLCDQVERTSNYDALTRIMPHIGIDVTEIQEMMKSKIRTLKTTDARNAVFNIMPMDSLLPIDTIQNILSFNHFSEMRLISKSFKKLFDQNQDNMRRLRQRVVDEYSHHFSPDISQCATGKAFVVLPDGEPLMECIKELTIGKDIVITNNFKDSFEASEGTGDTIYVQSGCYELTDGLFIEDEDCQIIGVGEGVEIKFNFGFDQNGSLGDEFGFTIRGKSNVLMKNISFTFGESETGIKVEGDSNLWIQSCEIHDCLNGIYMESSGTCHVLSCKFLSLDYGICIGSRGEDFANIIDCSFSGQNYCILTNSPVRCVGNFFKFNDRMIQFDPSVSNRSVVVGNVFEVLNDVAE